MRKKGPSQSSQVYWKQSLRWGSGNRHLNDGGAPGAKTSGEKWSRVGGAVSAKSLFISEAQARGSETRILVPVFFMCSETGFCLPMSINQEFEGDALTSRCR